METLDNIYDGRNLWSTGDEGSLAWFERQWKIWPARADERFTTNIAFLYGGILGYREDVGAEPIMTDDLRLHVRSLDKMLDGHHTG